MKYFALLIVLSGLTTTYAKSQNDTAWVFFSKGNESIELDDNFQLIFIYPQENAEIFYKPKVDSNHVILPDLIFGDSSHFFIFIYDSSIIVSGIYDLNYTDNIEFFFEYDQKPFENEYTEADVKSVEEEYYRKNGKTFNVSIVAHIEFVIRDTTRKIDAYYYPEINVYKKQVRSVLDFMGDE